MNKEILDLVEKILTFLKVEDYNKLKNILNIIEKDYPNYYKFFKKFKDRKIYLFGTFGWGSGKFMSNWIKQVEELGAKIVELPMACKGSPNSETKEKLANMAKKIATM